VFSLDILSHRMSANAWLRKLFQTPLPGWFSPLWDYFLFARNPPAVVSKASNNCPLFKHRVICGRSMEIFHQQEFSGCLVIL
jgi:hypothetical protein